jgi:hypothetical protein
VLQQATQGQLGSPTITIAAYQPLQVPQQVGVYILYKASAALVPGLRLAQPPGMCVTAS